MKLLGVETSSPVFSVALTVGERLACFLQAQGQGPPSLLLTELIRQASRQAGIPLGELDGFAVSAGPGSFTGLRVGITTVKTLAWALKKPVVPVSSLEAMARNVQGRPGTVLAFVDARKGKVYSACFRCEGDSYPQRLSPDRLLLPEEALRQEMTPPIWVVGDGVRRYEALLHTHQVGPDRLKVADPSLWIPRADEVCRLGQALWSSARLDDPHLLVPNYLYSKESDITGW